MPGGPDSGGQFELKQMVEEKKEVDEGGRELVPSGGLLILATRKTVEH